MISEITKNIAANIDNNLVDVFDNDGTKMNRHIKQLVLNQDAVINEYAKQVSIAFAEWIYNQKMDSFKGINNVQWIPNHGIGDSSDSTKELYEIFIQQYKP